MRHALAVAVAIVAVVLASAAWPAVAGAADVAVVGSFTDTVTGSTGPVSGALFGVMFDAQDKTLLATGQVAISLCIPGVDPKNCLASYDAPITTPVLAISGGCDGIVADLGTFHLLVGDRFVLDLETFGPLVGAGDRTRLQCTIARRVEAGAPLFTLAPSLNQL